MLVVPRRRTRVVDGIRGERTLMVVLRMSPVMQRLSRVMQALLVELDPVSGDARVRVLRVEARHSSSSRKVLLATRVRMK